MFDRAEFAGDEKGREQPLGFLKAFKPYSFTEPNTVPTNKEHCSPSKCAFFFQTVQQFIIRQNPTQYQQTKSTVHFQKGFFFFKRYSSLLLGFCWIQDSKWIFDQKGAQEYPFLFLVQNLGKLCKARLQKELRISFRMLTHRVHVPLWKYLSCLYNIVWRFEKMPIVHKSGYSSSTLALCSKSLRPTVDGQGKKEKCICNLLFDANCSDKFVLIAEKMTTLGIKLR